MRFKSFLQYNTLPYQKKGFSYLIYNKIYISASYKKAFRSNGEPSWALSPKTVAHNRNCSLFLCFLFLFHNFLESHGELMIVNYDNKIATLTSSFLLFFPPCGEYSLKPWNKLVKYIMINFLSGLSTSISVRK